MISIMLVEDSSVDNEAFLLKFKKGSLNIVGTASKCSKR